MMVRTLRLAVEESLPADFLLSGLAGADTNFDVLKFSGRSGLDAVRSGAAEIGLTSALSVILSPDDVDVVPAVALSSWKYPFAQLFMNSLEQPPETILFPPDQRDAAYLARIILKEHYGMSPHFEPAEVMDSSDAAVLRVGNAVAGMRFEGLRLDLGQEWYELANYPMVWGVFVMPKGAVTASVVEDLLKMAERTELLRTQWAASADQSDAIRRFFLEDVRVRFDDLAVASITQLMDFAFYYDLTDEIRDFPVASVEIDDAGRTQKPSL